MGIDQLMSCGVSTIYFMNLAAAAGLVECFGMQKRLAPTIMHILPEFMPRCRNKLRLYAVIECLPRLAGGGDELLGNHSPSMENADFP